MPAVTPTLSIACLTSDPGPLVHTSLTALRSVADEIVVAADARVGDDDLDYYAAAADVLLRVQFESAWRHLAWLHAQCEGDWVLLIDGDEVPSAALVEQLPSLVQSRSVTQYLLPRRWLYPGVGEWLDELPWWPDYQVRLVRNDGLLRFPGVIHTHAEPTRPARYLEEPLYHLDLLLTSAADRRAKAEAQRQIRPGLTAPGGGELNHSFYLPEEHARAPRTRVPAADRELLERALAAVTEPPEPREQRAAGATPDVVRTEEMDRLWAGRAVPEDAYRAEISPLERDRRMRAGERRPMHMRVTNRGTTIWPWDPDFGPAIKLSYHVRDSRGTTVITDGPRALFPCVVEPDDEVVVPLDVVAPIRPGSYTLEVDVVHEGVRWFGAACDVPIEVEPLDGWPAGPRGARTRGAIRRLLSRKEAIPKVLHRVWLGGNPLPPKVELLGETWRRHHPGWEMRLWDDEQAAGLVPVDALDRCRAPAEASNLVRYAVLHRFGGVYVDTDVECLRPIDDLLSGVSAFAAWEIPHRIGNAVLGSVAGHPLFEAAAREAPATAGHSIESVEANGPTYLTMLASDHRGLTVFDRELFYPFKWDEPHRRGEEFPDAYAIHHWDLSWKDGQS